MDQFGNYSPPFKKVLFGALSVVGIFGFLVFSYHGSRRIEDYSNELTRSSWRTGTTHRGLSLNGSTMHAEGLLIEETSDTRLDGRIVTSYCKCNQCGSVTCSDIRGYSEPGEVISEYIETEFKSACESYTSIKLILKNCRLKRLHKDWLQTDISIEELTLDTCSLTEIEGDAFSPEIYDETKKVSLINNNVRSLKRSAFRHLPTLEELIVRNNVVNHAEYDLLQDVAGTLKTLELDGAIGNAETLRNVTGRETRLKIQILSIRHNALSTVDRGIFSAVPEVQSLYLDNSKVNEVLAGAFDSIASSILVLDLSGNNISTLPAGLFDSIIHINSQFRLTIERNPWHCDCNLEWLQKLVKDRQWIVISVPSCRTPERNAMLSFTKAQFCPDSSADTSSTVIKDAVTTTPTTAVTSDETRPRESSVNVNCSTDAVLLADRGNSRKLLSNPDFRFRSRFPDFSASNTGNGSVLVSLPRLRTGVTLLWFESEDFEYLVRCVKNVRHSRILENLRPETTYIVCLLEDGEGEGIGLSPFNCLSITTTPTHDSETWLTNGEKSTLYTLTTLLLVLSSGLGALLMFLLIRRYPTLLRGSKRIMLLKQRNVGAFVLPKGVEVEGDDEDVRTVRFTPIPRRKSYEDGYVSPLPAVRAPVRTYSRFSRASSQSDGNSYVSGVEPTAVQLASWRLGTLEDQTENRKYESPPLPPPPRRNLPSVSMLVDFGEERRSEYSVCTV